MITGDNEETAKAIASESNIKEYYASCLPETKVETIKKLKEKYGTVAMVGDGINDAPALATASIGVAMGGNRCSFRNCGCCTDEERTISSFPSNSFIKTNEPY